MLVPPDDLRGPLRWRPRELRWLRSPIDSTRKTLSRTLAQRDITVDVGAVVRRRDRGSSCTDRARRNVGLQEDRNPWATIATAFGRHRSPRQPGACIGSLAVADQRARRPWATPRRSLDGVTSGGRIETYHKLLKGAGWQLESWLQRKGQGLLVKLMLQQGACASIWALERRDSRSGGLQEAADAIERPRQTKRNREVTTSGCWLDAVGSCVGPLARHGPDELNAMLENYLPAFAKNNGC